jgi:hypothetical protein
MYVVFILFSPENDMSNVQRSNSVGLGSSNNTQYRVYTGNYRRSGTAKMKVRSGARLVVELATSLGRLQQCFTCKNMFRISKRIHFREHEPKAARTSEHPTLTVLRTLSASARPGLTSY